MNAFNDFENDYIVFYTNGVKVRITAESEDNAYKQAHDLCPADGELDFVTHSGSDIPFDYDWDERLKAWQSRIF